MAKKKKKEEKVTFKRRTSISLVTLMWFIGLIPLFIILYLRYVEINTETLPSVTLLEHQQESVASTIFADDGDTEIGKFWLVNRTSVPYDEISPNVVSALISIEDERFEMHSGIDIQAVFRAVSHLGKAGGASTITQQLAKLIFTLKRRKLREKALETDIKETSEQERVAEMSSFERRLYEKVKENVIALRIEKRYSKNEIITKYLNQFDFLYNAVGIASAAKVYYNKKPSELLPQQAAMLVGMCKNPSLYNPYTFSNRNYRERIAKQKGIDPKAVSVEKINAERTEDSLRAINRRNIVLYKWYENSKKDNPALSVKLSKKEYDSLKQLPIVTEYNQVDYKDGFAPYYREHLREKVGDLLVQKNSDGSYKYAKSNGEPYNIYTDGLKIYTTVNIDLQKHAENAVVKHLKNNIQEPFTKNNKRSKHFPFAYDVDEKSREIIMTNARKRSERYYNLKTAGFSEKEILASFNEPAAMEIFSWDGLIDTVMTPNDSIRYYKNIMQAGLVSIEPQTGFIKAWVGGIDIHHFKYDHVAKAARQVGSTIKPFIYAAGMQFGVITPCATTPNIPYCVDVQKGANIIQWCPRNAGHDMEGEPIKFSEGLANSMNNITVAVMSRMGGVAGPQAVAKLMRSLNVQLAEREVVPSMCLGVMDLTLLELTSAQAAFVNKGIYNEPSSILRIEDRNGNTIYSNEHKTVEAMSADLAYATLMMMRQVVLSGTGTSLRGTWREWGGVTAPTAGKTGTTQNNADGWWLGLTPDLVTGVWVGAEDMAVRFRTMRWGQGARMALPIYGYMMQEVYKDPTINISTEEFTAPYGWENSIFNCKNKPEEQEGEGIDPGNFGI